MEIITGYTGQNHVTSADDASLYRGIFGQGDYVLDVGNKFAATIIDNNTVRIMDGDLVIQGHQARIRANDYEEVTIDNGTPDQKRNDLIVARYQKNATTGIESITLEVVKGTPGETATDPDIIQEDLSTGGTQRDFALYRVSLNGLALESVTSLFAVIPNLKDFMSHLEDTTTAHGIDTKARKGFGVGLKATLQNGWTTPTGIEYRKHEDLGLVVLKGSLKPGNTTPGTVILTLPKGYRPSSAVPVLIYDQMYGNCHVGMYINSAGGLAITHPFSGEVKEDSSIRIHVIFWTKE